jgi:L-ascorbate metabolism protein UlaG (beta-lactamase superfamily)
MNLTLLRNAALVLSYAGKTILVDPMLDPKGARSAIPNTANDRGNPLVALPQNAADLIAGVDTLLITHLHQDHYDTTARDSLNKALPLLCQPEDAKRLRSDGFQQVITVDIAIECEGIQITRTPAQHGTGDIARILAPVSGFVLEAEGEPTLYLAGDTIWYEPVAETIDRFRPDVIVINGSGARFNVGDPIVMTADEIAQVQRHGSPAQIVVDHLEAINHCGETRAFIDTRLQELDSRDRVHIPTDGETLTFSLEWVS